MAFLLFGRRSRTRGRIPRVFLPRIGLESIREVEFHQDYRFPREIVQELCSEYEASAFYRKTTVRSQAIPAEVEMLTALRFFAKGSYLSEIAKVHGVSKSSAFSAVHHVAEFLCSIASKHIKMPENREELSRTVKTFSEKFDMPNTCGCIDGTHIKLKAPNSEEWLYVNRKGQHSINVQVVTNGDLVFQDVVCKWPGSSHDSFVLRMSNLHDRFERGDFLGTWLLGDSGYGCRPWLLTPILTPHTEPECRYNTRHKKSRSSVERAIGILKSRFRCLLGTLELQPGAACQVFMACAVLHNIARKAQLPDPEPIASEDEDVEGVQDQRCGIATRRSVIDRFFFMNIN